MFASLTHLATPPTTTTKRIPHIRLEKAIHETHNTRAWRLPPFISRLIFKTFI
jgi:hypothetical protein